MTSGLPRLIVTGGALDGTVVALDTSEKQFGTAEGVDLRVQAGHIEPVHARVSWDGATLRVSDAGSVSGTYVNGEKIGVDHALQDGDRVCLGPPGFKGSVKMIVSLPAGLPDEVPFVPSGGEDLPFAAEPASDEPLLLDPAAFAVPASPPSFFGAPDAQPRADEAFTLDPEPLAPSFSDSGSDPVPQADAPFTLDSTPEDDWTRTAPTASPFPEDEGGLPMMADPAPAPTPAPIRAATESRPAKHQFSDNVPSMITTSDRVREAIDLPPRDDPSPRGGGGKAASKRSVGPRAAGNLKRTLLINAGIALAAIVALVAYRAVHRPAPVLSPVTATGVHPGDPLTLQGTGFAAQAGDNTVMFGDTRADVTSASETSLGVVVPKSIQPGTTSVPLTVEAGGSVSKPVTVTIVHGPRVASLEPDVALPGREITIKGVNFSGDPLVVTVGDQPATVGARAADSVRITVPQLTVTEGKTVPVVVKVGAEAAPAVKLTLGQLPLVTEVAPVGGQTGDKVTIRGRGFDPLPGGNLVEFEGVRALVLSAGPSELTVIVPATAVRSSLVDQRVLVSAGGGRSSGSSIFKLSGSTASAFMPRYYAAPSSEHPGHDHAFVSCELGPVLLLSGRAGRESTAARAVDVATALNALVQAASKNPVTLEARDTDPPAVGIAGFSDVLVTATPEDVAGYAEAWDDGKGSRATQKALATYWTALLQDHVTLFVARQRPIRTVELSPRGKAFLEVYSDAARRGDPGSGIAASLVLTPAFLQSHRQIALQLPVAGQSAAVAVVAGRWSGTMDDGTGQKAIQVQFKVDGNKLSGLLSTQSGAVAMNMPLRDVAYDKGTLRFVLVAGNTPRRFNGKVDGKAVQGTIQTGTSATPGTFALRFAE